MRTRKWLKRKAMTLKLIVFRRNWRYVSIWKPIHIFVPKVSAIRVLHLIYLSIITFEQFIQTIAFPVKNRIVIVFKNINCLQKHMRQHIDLKPFECPYDDCTYRSPYKHKISRHLKVKHSTDRPFKCTFSGCDKSYAIQSDLNYHLNTTHATEYDFKCNECDKSYRIKAQLVSHQKIHLSEPTLKCPHEGCQELFRTNVLFDSKPINTDITSKANIS